MLKKGFRFRLPFTDFCLARWHIVLFLKTRHPAFYLIKRYDYNDEVCRYTKRSTSLYNCDNAATACFASINLQL